ncbi:hypothetical protein FUT69_09240 [Xylella taiwanensis]|uniref:Uncharacterized protein n=1 Tax=Xylella taiwanensis TaxID=1444770 RepID=A0ABS8TX60_9GAMM|nr:hypothetical protein [Xylella taiwanensis]MCD8456313.1 hypothetical protein [Xylella taiwanensis]MCD8458721.1 hypothetical protein [Xylella taiwanensis]MCD8460856.1 hypothetical protein [Xylella taiwanensis]MCD8463085.1 hypothetical protein [Xylella taiwanensis]MCD8465364.1 hypothetical protein [Xylella taiwanensis]
MKRQPLLLQHQAAPTTQCPPSDTVHALPPLKSNGARPDLQAPALSYITAYHHRSTKQKERPRRQRYDHLASPIERDINREK